MLLTVKRRRARTGEDRALTRENVPAVMLAGTVAGVPINAEAALRIVDVLACVRLLAETASTLPLISYRRLADGGRERYDGALHDLLDRPSPATTQANLIAQTVGCLALRGNAFWGKYRADGGEIEQIAVLPNDRVTVQIRGGLPFYTLTHLDGRQTTHGQSDVLHFRGLSMDGVVGLSPIAQCREALGLAASLRDHASALFANGAAPRGILTVPGGPGEDDHMKALALAWEARHQGGANAGRVAVLTGDVAFTPISLSPADAEFVSQRKLSSTEIARLFRVPPHLIGAEAGNSLTYSNVESEGLDFLRFSLAPWLTVVEQGVAVDPDLSPPGVFVEFLRDAMLRADSKTRADVYATALDPQKGWMRRDEVRRLENLPPEGVANA
jgi:HK97 family phage portal protein